MQKNSKKYHINDKVTNDLRVQAPLVSFIQYDDRILVQLRVGKTFTQENSIS